MATAREHGTRAMQDLSMLPEGVLPSSDQETVILAEINAMLFSWDAMRSRADLDARNKLAQIAVLAQSAAMTAPAGSATLAILQTTLAAAATGLSTAALTALSKFTIITTDVTTYPAGFDDAIHFNLAIRLAAVFKRPVPESVAAMAKVTYEAIIPPIGAAA